MSELKSIGALCILGLKNEEKKYKIEYTKSCQSQIIKTYKSHGQNIDIYLYKYCSRSDSDKIRDILKDNRSIIDPNSNWYDIELNALFEKFIEYFEPDMI